MAYSRHLPVDQAANKRKMYPEDVASCSQISYNDSYQEKMSSSDIQHEEEKYSNNPKLKSSRIGELYRSNSKDFLCPVDDHSREEFKYCGNDDHPRRYAATNLGYQEHDYSETEDHVVKSYEHQVNKRGFHLEEHIIEEPSTYSKNFSNQSTKYYRSGRYMHEPGISYNASTSHESKVEDDSKYQNYKGFKKRDQQFHYKRSPSEFLEMKQYDYEYATKYPEEYGYKFRDVSESAQGYTSSYNLNNKMSSKGYKESEKRFHSGRDSFDSTRTGAKSEIPYDRRGKSVEQQRKGTSDDWFPDEEFETVSKIVHRKYSTGYNVTMKDAKRIARTVSAKLDHSNQVYSENLTNSFSSESIDSEHLHSRKRVFWAKQHLNSKSSSAMAKRSFSRTGKNLFLEHSVPARGKSVWQAKKAKGKIKESLKEFFSKLQVWSTSLKFIEGHFGTSVVSYFVFLRWLLFLNLYIFIVFLVFIVLPQVYFPALQQRKNITTAPTTEILDSNLINQLTGPRKLLSEYEPRISPTSYLDVLAKHSSLDSDRLKNLGSLFDTYVGPKFLDVALNYGRTNYTAEVRHNFSEYCYQKYVDMVIHNTSCQVSSVVQDFFQGTGWMELTLMFTGYYLPTDLLVSGTGLYYNLSVAFLGVLFALYIVCLIMMINYASKGVRENLLSTEVGVQSYCNMVFCGWDYCIENDRTANLKHRSILLELKGNLAEVRRQQDIAQWTTLHKVKVYLIRSIVSIFVIASLVGTYYLIYYVAQIQLKEQSVPKHEGFSELLIQFLPSITITAVNFILPVIFDILVRYESYGVQAALNTTLVRIIFVRLASIIILVITFHRQIACEPKDMCFIGKEGCSSPICWETHVGQQMYRLVMMDFFVVIGVTFIWEVPRNFIVQKWKCKLTEIIGRQTFDVPSQVLAIVYAQTLCWLGVFYSPLLPVVCVLKIIILFYVKKFTLIVNCVPSQISYRASRSNAVFVIVLMLNFFITVAILGYSITSIAPSPACSPFRHLNYMVDAIREALNTWSPHITQVLRYIFSTGFAIATIIFLCLAIYYYLTVTAAHKRMIKVLKSQLVLEGRDKQFLLKRLTEVACEEMATEN